MKLARHTTILSMVGALAFPAGAFAATATVNGLPDDVPNATFANLSGAVAWVQLQDDGPHTINVTADVTPGADTQILINEPMTIEGDANNLNGPCDILVDLDGIEGGTNIGLTPKSYIEIQTAGAVTIRNLKIHPDADGTATGTNNAVNGIQMFPPVNASDVANYTLEKVWVSGSDSSNNFINLDTGTDLWSVAGTKRWSRNLVPNPANSNTRGDQYAPIVLSKTDGAGQYFAHLNNCHAGLSLASALGIDAGGSTVTITGGVYGHSLRDAMHIENAYLTMTGSPTNRVRVLRTPHVTSRDAHGVEIEATTVSLMQYVDAECMSSGNSFKFSGDGTADLVRYCRALGKFDSGANGTLYVSAGYRLPQIWDSTFIGSGNDYRPVQIADGTAGDIHFYNCIFASENLGALAANNLDALGGVQSLTNCALPTDGGIGESLNTATPITNGSGAFLPALNGTTINSSPVFEDTRIEYDWSEAAVSIDGSNASAGNPLVLRPTNVAYTSIGLIGGAGSGNASVSEWSLF